MNYDNLNPTDHAQVIIQACHGDPQEALATAHTNVEFAWRDDDRRYWDRVAIAIQAIITDAALPLHAFVGPHGEILRVTPADPAEIFLANQLLRAIGCDRRWMILSQA